MFNLDNIFSCWPLLLFLANQAKQTISFLSFLPKKLSINSFISFAWVSRQIGGHTVYERNVLRNITKNK